MKKGIVAATTAGAAASTTTSSTLPIQWYSNVGDIPLNFLEGLDPRQQIVQQFIQPASQQHLETSSANSLITSGSPSPAHKQHKTGGFVDGVNLINGMANLSPSQLLSNAVAFQSAASVSPSHLVQQAQQQIGDNHPAVSPQLVQQLTRPRSKAARANSAVAAHVVANTAALNGLSPEIFGSAVAFPGNPLQNQASFEQQQQSASPRQMQQQQQQSQQVLSLSNLDIQTSSAGQSRVGNSSAPTNVITSNNAAAVAAAVAVAHPQYTQYINNWPCPACKVTFRTANELQTHLSAHFVPPKQGQPNSVAASNFNANASSNTFNSASMASKNKDQSVHMKKDKSVPCNECGKLFTSAERVRVHVRVAHGEKTCACEICGCGFSYRCKLLNHMRTHTGDKPFTCEVCGRSFSQKNHLKRHHMIHTGERPFPCDICGRSFYRKDKLTRHRRIHTNPTPSRSMRTTQKSAAAASQLVSPLAMANQVKMQSAVTSQASFPTLPGSATAIQLITPASIRQLGGMGAQTSWVLNQPTRQGSQDKGDDSNQPLVIPLQLKHDIERN